MTLIRSLKPAPVVLLFTLSVLTLLAGRPLWSSAAFFNSDDGLLHLLRVYALDRAVQQGIIYPRWLMDLAYGYGYPMFNFYPPLAEFLAESFHLVGFDFAAAIKATSLASILIASYGAYVLGRELFPGEGSTVAGFVTAAAYVFFPYFLYDIYSRGATAEALAAAILPWAVWSLHRVLRTSDLTAILLLALFLAAMLLAHSLTMILCAPALLGYFLFEWMRLDAKERMRALARMGGAGALGAGLGAFYWLPFIADLPTVRMGRGIYAIQDAFQSNFLSLDRLIQFDFFYHYDPPPVSLGVLALFLAALGIFFAIVVRSRARALVLFFGALAAVSALLMLEQTKDLWLAVPFATMIQYPWRISVLIDLGIAVLIGSLPASLSSLFKIQRNLARGVIAALTGIALVWSAMAHLDLQPLYLSNDSPTLGQLARMEAYTGSLGTTTWGEYLPAAVRPVNLLNFKASGAPPSAEEIRLLEYTPYRRVVNVSASEPFTLTFRTLYNPAWRVQVDGRTIPAFPNTPMSLLATTVPAGAHQMQFDLQEGSAQAIGFLLSAASLSVLLALMVLYRRESQAKSVFTTTVCCLGIFAIPAFFALSIRPQDLQPVQLAASPSVDLIGLRIENAHLEGDVWRVGKAESALHLTAFWQAGQSLQDQPVAWRLVDTSGSVRAGGVQLPRYGTGVAAGWIPNEIVQDEYDVPLQGVTRGRYSLQVSWGAKEFSLVSTVFFEQAVPAPETIIQNRVNARVGEQIRLLGYNVPSTVRPGEKLPATLFWQADKSVSTDYTAFVQLHDEKGTSVARPRVDTPPGGGLAFTSLWNPGEIVVDRVEIDLPPDLRPGVYRLIAGLYHYPDLDRLAVLSEDGEPMDDYVVLGPIRVQ